MAPDFTKWFKKYFIPHEYNGNKPHFLRKRSVVIVLTAILFVEALFLIQTLIVLKKTDFYASVLPNVLLELTNGSRHNTKLAQLTINPILQQAAQLKANDMAAKGYFSHTSPEGVTPWFWFKKVGYQFTHAGENLAINYFDTADVNNAWLASPSHRANILNSSFTEMGIGIAKGDFHGQKSIFIVEFFGRPKTSKTVSAAQANNATEKNIAAGKIPESIKPGKADTATVEGVYTTSFEENPNLTVISTENISIQEPIAPESSQKKSLSPLAKIKEILSMPRTVTTRIFFVFFAIVFLALALKIIVKMRIQYFSLVGNGVFLLLVIFTIIFLNKYISLSAGLIK